MKEEDERYRETDIQTERDIDIGTETGRQGDRETER